MERSNDNFNSREMKVGGNFVMSKDVLEVYPKEMTIKELLRLFHKTIRVEESRETTSGANLSREEIYENQTFVAQRLQDFSKIDYILKLGKKPLCENFRPSEKSGDWSYGTYHLCLVDAQ